MSNNVTSKRRIAFFRILSSSEVKTVLAGSKPSVFSYFGSRGNLHSDRTKTRGGNPGTARDFIADRRHSCHLGEKEIKNEQTRTRITSTQGFSPSSGIVGSGASGVKSDDKCAPANNINPEINAQN